MKAERATFSGLVRVHDSVLAVREKQLLTGIGRRLPAFLQPDHMTALGVAGAAVTAVGCVASNFAPMFALLGVAGLALNWFGDSLDGTLARLRRAERPKYGFFIDQISDVASHFFILIGFGLSPFMQMNTALLALLGSMLVMFYGHLRLQFSYTWQVSHHGVGPTELRIIMAAGLVLGALFGVPAVTTPIGEVSLFDAVAASVFVGSIACVALMFRDDRAKLAAMDPVPNRSPVEVSVRTLEEGGAFKL